MPKIGLVTFVTALVLDQISKWYLVGLLAPENRVIEVLPFFKLVMWWNEGISFGLFSKDSEANRWMLIALTGTLTAGLFFWLLREKKPVVSAGLGLIIGGALGNIIDRLHWRAVADFFYFYYKDWYWPAFNIADSCIFIGVALLLWDNWKGKQT